MRRRRERRSATRRRAGLGAAVGGLLVSGVALPAASPVPRAETPEFALFVTYRITNVPRVPSGLYRATGTFTATGSPSDSGTASSLYRITGRGPDSVRGESAFRGKRGRLVVRFQASVDSIGKGKINERPGPSSVVGLGSWRVVSGTGGYTSLRGKTGTVGYTIDFRRRTGSSLHLLL